MQVPVFAIPLIVWWLIQLFKILIDLVKEWRFDYKNFFRAWWFPSVHSGISTSIATLMFLIYWYESSEFAISIIFAFLFWYDAMNIRYEAWKHASYINKISIELKTLLNFSDNYFYLKERLWHTFLEVVWWIVIWCLLTILVYYQLQSFH